ncbi:16248_t:CDS:2 [Gigaspora margarita]|uniref:16248_t:CDS:1 n=1 Tax=Gigaspora margarita TaxID=4874 RepID=A0ABN7VI02_GIGMA|nr:16248_t:CDS:2 [Gigaspora margarita]
MDPSNHEVLVKEFLQVAYLAPSLKHDESANRLFQMKKVLMHEVNKKQEKSMFRDPTDICCQCLDFLQKEIICKHLHGDSNNNSTAKITDDKDIEDTDNKSDNQKDYKNNDSYISTLSEEVLNYMKNIFGISTDSEKQ